jgi:hypothetical protein
LRVARELDRIAELRSYPCMIVSDNGTELTSNAILTWQQECGVEELQGNAAIENRFGVAEPDLQRGIEAGQRFIGALKLQEHNARL